MLSKIAIIRTEAQALPCPRTLHRPQRTGHADIAGPAPLGQLQSRALLLVEP